MAKRKKKTFLVPVVKKLIHRGVIKVKADCAGNALRQVETMMQPYRIGGPLQTTAAEWTGPEEYVDWSFKIAHDRDVTEG